MNSLILVFTLRSHLKTYQTDFSKKLVNSQARELFDDNDLGYPFLVLKPNIKELKKLVGNEEGIVLVNDSIEPKELKKVLPNTWQNKVYVYLHKSNKQQYEKLFIKGKNQISGVNDAHHTDGLYNDLLAYTEGQMSIDEIVHLHFSSLDKYEMQIQNILNQIKSLLPEYKKNEGALTKLEKELEDAQNLHMKQRKYVNK